MTSRGRGAQGELGQCVCGDCGGNLPHWPWECAARQRRNARLAAREEWGRWLGGLRPWAWFVTLTVPLPSAEDQRRGYDRRGKQYCRQLVLGWLSECRERDARTAARDIPMIGEHGELLQNMAERRAAMDGARREFAAWVTEEAHKSGVPHYHALLYSPRMATGALQRTSGWDAATLQGFGLVRILPIHGDRRETVASYVAKYVVKDGDAWITTVGLSGVGESGRPQFVA